VRAKIRCKIFINDSSHNLQENLCKRFVKIVRERLLVEKQRSVVPGNVISCGGKEGGEGFILDALLGKRKKNLNKCHLQTDITGNIRIKNGYEILSIRKRGMEMKSF